MAEKHHTDETLMKAGLAISEALRQEHPGMSLSTRVRVSNEIIRELLNSGIVLRERG